MTKNIIRALLLAACAAGAGCAPTAVPPPPTGDAGPEYVFVPDTDRLVAIIRGDLELIGKLDAAGNFLEIPHYRHKAGEPRSKNPGSELINGVPGPYYEYRSGRLIKGEIRKDGSFVPDVGPTVTRFEDYRYSPQATRIWNLPGLFVKKRELKEYLRKKSELKESLRKDP